MNVRTCVQEGRGEVGAERMQWLHQPQKPWATAVRVALEQACTRTRVSE